MTLNTLTQCEPWMTPQEHDLNQSLIHALTSYLTDAGVPQNALVALRINDIASTWLLARRLESALAPAEGQPAPCPTPAQANAICKCRERLSKAIKELEEYTAKNGAPAPKGLVEKMHEAVRIVRAAGISTNNFTRVNPSDQETESNAPETPDDPSPANNAPEMPASPSPENYPPKKLDDSSPKNNAPKIPGNPDPENNTPADHRQFKLPGERRKIGAENRDKYRHRKAPQPAQPAPRSNYAAIDIPYAPPRHKPPQNTG